MANDKVNMPSGSGGLMRYFDEYKSKIQIKPGLVVVFILVIIILVLILHLYGKGWFGI